MLQNQVIVQDGSLGDQEPHPGSFHAEMARGWEDRGHDGLRGSYRTGPTPRIDWA